MNGGHFSERIEVRIGSGSLPPEVYRLVCLEPRTVCRAGFILTLEGKMGRGALPAKDWRVVVVCANEGEASRLEDDILSPGPVLIEKRAGVRGIVALLDESAESTGISAEVVIRVLADQGITASLTDTQDDLNIYHCSKR